MVIINGVEQNAAGLTVEHYLETAHYDSARIVVERNGEIVPKTQYGQTVLNDGDTVEVISFVGGGGDGQYSLKGRNASCYGTAPRQGALRNFC